jgi:2-keto-4-pentenoate hydratase
MQHDEESRRLAERLVRAENEGRSVDTSGKTSDLDEKKAYRVQDLGLEIRGERRVGFKLGFTSAAMRRQMNVPHPNYGRLLSSMELDGPLLDLQALIHPRLEPEIALFVERDLDGEGVTLNDVRGAVDWASAAVEIVDSRFSGYRFTPSENTADNSSAARFLLGRRVRLETIEPRLTGVLLSRNGLPLGSGVGADALGGPLQALRWLCGRLAEQGRVLEGGSIVLTGGLTRAEPLSANDTFVAEFASLGSLTLHCSGVPTEPEDSSGIAVSGGAEDQWLDVRP